jgi:hypothetical protein
MSLKIPTNLLTLKKEIMHIKSPFHSHFHFYAAHLQIRHFSLRMLSSKSDLDSSTVFQGSGFLFMKNSAIAATNMQLFCTVSIRPILPFGTAKINKRIAAKTGMRKGCSIMRKRVASINATKNIGLRI